MRSRWWWYDSWEQALQGEVLAFIASSLVLVVLHYMFRWSDGRYCRQCRSRKQWRWKKPYLYAKRSYCIYCDEDPAK
jgi:hypothetical protein